jgi:hypothetical protein
LARPFLHSICRFCHGIAQPAVRAVQGFGAPKDFTKVAMKRRIALAALGTGVVALVASRPAPAQTTAARQLVWGMGDIAGQLARMKA